MEPEIPSTMTMREVIAHNVKTLRKNDTQEGQAAFAARLKALDPSGRAWSVNRVSEAERGERNFSMDDLVLFARALQVPVSRLVLIPVAVESIRMDNGTVIPKSALQDQSVHPDAPEQYLREVGVAAMQWHDDAEGLELGLEQMLEAVLKMVDEVHQQRVAVKRLKHDAFDIHSLTTTARRDILRHKRGDAPEVRTD